MESSLVSYLMVISDKKRQSRIMAVCMAAVLADSDGAPGLRLCWR